ncbi:ankyrin repeat-containing domain protein [Dactylonectria estremocensis]|uniref:Ankyrin repeat-containing domain protein n=1 Tax=Dactylonectria estremocensis TaxID=1079267 RepID=A0A9P9J9U5_9HYPO|nr:ankyrin repeat-containing domain protein [Dactylonectria estremocensis]
MASMTDRRVSNTGVVTANNSNIHQHFYHGSDERSDVLKWLYKFSSFRFAERQTNYTQVAHKVPGTGGWLLQHPKFRSWRDGTSSRLWCQGKLGAGKTILASIIIEYLNKYFTNDEGHVSCIYVYFDHRDFERIQKASIVTKLLANLLAQTIASRHHHDVSPQVRKAYNEHSIKESDPVLKDLIELLRSELTDVKKLFIVVDAFDECPNYAGVNARTEFSDAIYQLPPNVNVLFFSSMDWIQREIKVDDTIQFSADEGDLKLYIQSRLDSCDVFKKVLDIGERGDLSSETVIKTIVENAQGIFHIAQHYVELLVRELTIDGLRKRLEEPPEIPKHIYETTFARIENQDPQRRALGFDVLCWVLYASRPLTLPELCHAVAIKEGDSHLRNLKQRLVDENDMASALHGMIVVNPNTLVVQLVHATAKEWLEDHMAKTGTPAKSHSKLAEKCLAYLSLREFGQDRPTERKAKVYPKEEELRQREEEARRQKEQLRQRKETYPLLSYAADHWYSHSQAASEERLCDQVWNFLSDGNKVSSCVEAMGDRTIAFETKVTGLHLATHYGSEAFVEILIKNSANTGSTTSNGETALHWAASNGRTAILEKLIGAGADINVVDKSGRNALHKAVKNNKLGTIEALLRHEGLNINLTDSSSYTPLRLAAQNGYDSIVKLLVRNGANINIQCDGEWNALRDASMSSHASIVKYLLRKGGKHTVKSSSGCWSVLCWAAERGHISIVSLLLDMGTDVNATTNEGHSALRCAIEYGYNDIVWLLLRRRGNLNIDLPDEMESTPLHAAIRVRSRRKSTLLWLILESGADPNARDNQRRTPLHIAAIEGDYSAAWILLEQDETDPNARDKRGRGALHIAAEKDDIRTAQILLEKGADNNLKDKGDRTALHLASLYGKHRFVSFLLKNGADATVLDGTNKTAFHWATTEFITTCLADHAKVMEYLVQETRAINAQDDSGQTVLHTMVSGGSLSMDDRRGWILDLLNHGADPNVQDYSLKQTPLHRAVLDKDEHVILAMVKAGADVWKRDSDGRTALDFANDQGDQFLRHLLSRSGKDM